jgi:hypothetical protein
MSSMSRPVEKPLQQATVHGRTFQQPVKSCFKLPFLCLLATTA